MNSFTLLIIAEGSVVDWRSEKLRRDEKYDTASEITKEDKNSTRNFFL
jgi:hypothetical protein